MFTNFFDQKHKTNDYDYLFLDEPISERLSNQIKQKAYTVMGNCLGAVNVNIIAQNELLEWIEETSQASPVIRWQTLLHMRDFFLSVEAMFKEANSQEYSVIIKDMKRVPLADRMIPGFSNMLRSSIDFCINPNSLTTPSLRRWAQIVLDEDSKPSYKEFLFGLVMNNDRLVYFLGDYLHMDAQMVWFKLADAGFNKN